MVQAMSLGRIISDTKIPLCARLTEKFTTESQEPVALAKAFDTLEIYLI